MGIPEGFQSTPSARRATARLMAGERKQNISIHALREEGDLEARDDEYRTTHISIHALREEGDHYRPPAHQTACISIHALREEGDRVPYLLI